MRVTRRIEVLAHIGGGGGPWRGHLLTRSIEVLAHIGVVHGEVTYRGTSSHWGGGPWRGHLLTRSIEVLAHIGVVHGEVTYLPGV